MQCKMLIKNYQTKLSNRTAHWQNLCLHCQTSGPKCDVHLYKYNYTLLIMWSTGIQKPLWVVQLVNPIMIMFYETYKSVVLWCHTSRPQCQQYKPRVKVPWFIYITMKDFHAKSITMFSQYFRGLASMFIIYSKEGSPIFKKAVYRW